MAILAKQQTKASHWYMPDGTPKHSIIKKNGDGERPTTIADARKLYLIPSVTNILGVLSKEALSTWKVKQAILQTLKSPKTPDESDDYYCKRIADASMEQVAEAADLGSDIHRALEAWLDDGIQPPPNLMDYAAPVLKWFKETDIRVAHTEKILVNLEQGYAGTADVLFTYGKHGKGVIDFKTRKTAEGKKIEPYDGQAMQLAAYAAAEYGHEALAKVLIANVYISTTEPGRVEVVKHENPITHYKAFLACCRLWRYQKNYDPRQKPEEK
jgi:hypothetical protein